MVFSVTSWKPKTFGSIFRLGTCAGENKTIQNFFLNSACLDLEIEQLVHVILFKISIETLKSKPVPFLCTIWLVCVQYIWVVFHKTFFCFFLVGCLLHILNCKTTKNNKKNKKKPSPFVKWNSCVFPPPFAKINCMLLTTKLSVLSHYRVGCIWRLWQLKKNLKETLWVKSADMY